MKSLTLILAMSLSISQAHAWGFDKKYSSYPDQDEVIRLPLRVGSKGSVTATGIVHQGSFRLENVTGQSTAVFTISSPLIKKVGLDKFLSECDRNRELELFDLVQEKDNEFILEGEALPLNRASITALMGDMKDETIFTDYAIDTPLDESLMGAHSKSAGVTAKSIRRILDPQIQKQKDRIWENGRIKLDLSGQDAFVCDLLTKKTTLVLGTRLGYVKAMPNATTAITPQELRSVVEKMENRSVKTKSARDAIALNAILQNEAMKEVLNKDIHSFDVSKFLKISNAVVDENTGALKIKSFDFPQIKRLARSLDDLEYLNQLSNVMVYPDIQVK
jgi:hypothetical protein